MQGLKHGAADDCTCDPLCDTVAIVARANWDCSGQASKECTNSNLTPLHQPLSLCVAQGMLFRHVTNAAHVAAAGGTLAGWTNPRIKVFAPDVSSFLTDENADLYQEFCECLFARTDSPKLHDTRLVMFWDTMMTTF